MRDGQTSTKSTMPALLQPNFSCNLIDGVFLGTTWEQKTKRVIYLIYLRGNCQNILDNT